VNDDSVFGPIVEGSDVKAAIEATLRKWMPTYLALIERHAEREPKSMPIPRSYVLTDDPNLNKKVEDQLPAVVVMTPGNGERRPKHDGRGIYSAGFRVVISIVASARDQPSTTALAERYRKAVELMLLHQGSLGGFAEASVFVGWRTDDMDSSSDRTIAAGTNIFEVLVKGIAQHGAGLREPLKEPYEEAELPTITEVDVDVEPEGP
jgi:hypothetical protein